MEFHLVSQTGTTWQLQHGGNCLGIVHLTQNPFHCAHRNLTLELQDWDEIIAPAVISLLRRQCPEPLKYMVDSTEQQQIRFLRAGGFRLARRCFVREFPRHQCKSPPAARLSLSRTHRGQPHWERCGALLLQKYIRQHESISPLTATRTQFFEALPETVLYFESSGEIRHFAFVEDNEIAYLWSADAESRPLFLESVLYLIFARFETVTFEADEHDTDAMALRPFFEFWGNYTHNTYLLDEINTVREST